MTKKRWLCAVFIGTLLGGCQPAQKVAVGTVYNGDLAKALQHRGVADEKRAPIEFESGATAQTCREYERLLAKSAVKEGTNNQIAKGNYLICEALALVGDKDMATAKATPAFGEALATRLDLRSFPSSWAPMLDDRKFLMSQLDPKAIKIEPTAATYQTGDWRYRLEVVATLDINDNGKTDWVLWLADEAQAGNYRQYQTLIVPDVGDTGLLHAMPYAMTMNAKPH